MGWQDEIIPADFTVEQGGSPILARDHEFFKTAPDKETFLKNAYEAHREIGRRIPLPNGNSKPEDIAKWKAEHLPKLTKAGLIDAPRQAPETYEIKLPDGVPQDAFANDPDFKEAQAWAKKLGLSKEEFAEGFNLAFKSLAGAYEGVQVDRQASAAKVKEWADKQGITVEQVDAALDRFNKDPRGWDEATADAVSKSGYADNPLVVQAIYKLMTDSGMFDTRNDGGSMSDNQDGNAAALEANDIVRNKDNPKYAAYHRGDPDVSAYVNQLFKKAHPGTVEI